MKGWWGKVLVVDLSQNKAEVLRPDPEVYAKFVGGRGLAIWLLWNLVPPGADPFSPYNAIVIASGPLTGLPLPSSGKLVVASKSPLTGGYGDGNIGTMAAYHLRRSGFDAIVVKGAARRPSYLLVEGERAEVLDAEHLWGLDAFSAEDKLVREHGKGAGVLLIGPAGERLVRFATVVSQKGRSGGRPGMGAVMGSKKLKAIVIKGAADPELHDKHALRSLAESEYKEILAAPNYDFWIRQGTMATIRWSQENSVLPTYNFREGAFEEFEGISGDLMEKLKVDRRGCPFCNMACGNVVEDDVGAASELDYENVAMLGSNLGLGDLRRVALLNRLADMYGVDTISLGNAIGFYIEASEKGLVDEKIEWGDYGAIRSLVEDVGHRRGIGAFVADGVKMMSESLGGPALEFAMHVKGLEVSAYDCHAAPGMALAYGTSPIGAHHKDAWIISYEIRTDRLSYGEEKVERLVYLQDIRGGLFESLTVCRLPWVEVGASLEYYPKMLAAVTGLSYTWDELRTVANRIYTLIRLYWIRELGYWARELDMPPARWFKHPLTKGPYAGHKLRIDLYNKMLDKYYELRGWDKEGVPKGETISKLGLEFALKAL
ncbi:MAG: aldehyde ferredoxin oxidoreductase family protein [Desulfurococcaceae archaeon]